ncbi:MAG: tryptophan--tRNA ligase [Candidatus Omnitrophota bacterium]|jgi:tryptophanyl-tRNA synthetase
MKKRILSGMRPTGKLHLGHLVGALENWAKLQDEYECFFMVADWHALMSEYANPQNLKDSIFDNVVDWLACGLDPEKSTIFIQSHVKEHLELNFILSVITPLGWLERCPTYKEQLREVTNRDLSTYGFLGYPVLQAADILIYKANAVPVGEDQLPHLELAREIARKFNHLYKKDIFPEPQALLTKTARLSGLDGRKMSKSYNNFIALSDEPEDIRKKVQAMFTDPKKIKLNDAGHPDKCNLFDYYNLFLPGKAKELNTLCAEAQRGCTACKKELADILIDFLSPIRQRRSEYLKHKDKIFDILDNGAEKASNVAAKSMSEIKNIIGLI